MERNRKCENMILDILKLKKVGCHIDAFDDGVFDKQTVNLSMNNLLHEEKIHNNGLTYHIGAPHPKLRMMRNGRMPKPNLKIKEPKEGKPRKRSDSKIRADRYFGDLTDKGSSEI